MLGHYALGQQELGGSGIANVVLPSAVGAYVFSGQNASLRVTRRLVADVGSFALSGLLEDGVIGRVGLGVRGGGGASRLFSSSGGGGKGLRIRA